MNTQDMMTEDEEIVFRVFEYGFGHAYKNRVIEENGEIMEFPQPCIIYLDEGKKDRIPDEYTLVLQFRDQGEFSYKVPIYKLQNISIQELNDKKLIALLPFLLLKLRKKLEKACNEENIKELKELILYDIIQTINKMIDLKPNHLDSFVFLRFIYLCLHKSLHWFAWAML